MEIPKDLGQKLLEQDASLKQLTDILPDFIETVGHLFNRTFWTSNLADRLIVTLGHVCMEDFFETLVLCGHGFGIGGLKMVRSLYERAVTLAYIAVNAGEADTFLDYQPINEGKFLEHARSLKLVGLLGFSEERIAAIDAAYKEAKDKYRETLCKKCGTSRVQLSWSKKDLKSIAQSIDENWAKLYLSCYMYPTHLAHATVPAVKSRMLDIESGGFRYKHEAQGEHVRSAIVSGCTLMLRVLDDLNRYFHLNFEPEIQKRKDEFEAFMEK